MTIKSARLTTQQILQVLETAVTPDYLWEWVVDHYVCASTQEEEDAKSAARFLESWQPGRTWSAEDFHGLMYGHFTGRWGSAEEIGAIRASENLAEKDYGDDHEAKAQATALLEKILASDEECIAYLKKPGTHVFTDIDGTVLTFDQLYHGIITEYFDS